MMTCREKGIWQECRVPFSYLFSKKDVIDKYYRVSVF